MPFQLGAGDSLGIGGVRYVAAEHPSAPGMPYGQEGRQATVYQLVAGAERRALKVFEVRHRDPLLVALSARLQAYADLPGLAVCRRTVLTPAQHMVLLRAHPDLIYAVLMPWIKGPTWMQVLLEKRALVPETSLALARSFASMLAGMEQQGLAHCDLSGPNVLLPGLLFSGSEGRALIALVDVEQLYAPDLRRPPLPPGGSPGYAHRMAPDGLWSREADRFAGAVLLSEMLCWCDQRVREAAWGESYFEPVEVQQKGQRCDLLRLVLRERWGNGVSELFERAWHSDTLAEAANFGEWVVALPETVPSPASSATVEEGASRVAGASPEAARSVAEVLMALALPFAEQGKLDTALETYREAQRVLPAGDPLAAELGPLIAGLESRAPAGALEAEESQPALPTVTDQPLPTSRPRVPLWARLPASLFGVALLVLGVARLTGRGAQALSPTATANMVAAHPAMTPSPTPTPSANASPTATATPTTTPTATPTSTAARPPTSTATRRATVIPATTAAVVAVVQVVANKAWQASGVEIHAGDRIVVEYVSGLWTSWASTLAPFPAGGPSIHYVYGEIIAPSSCREPMPTHQSGALMGRIGKDLLGISSRLAFTSQSTGTLELRINDADDALYDNEGWGQVRLTVLGPSPAGPGLRVAVSLSGVVPARTRGV